MGQDRYESARKKSLEAAEYLQIDDYESALSSFLTAEELLPEDGQLARAQLSSNIGHVYVRLQRYDEAISWFGKALEFFVLNGDHFCSAEQLGNIGSVHRDTENWAASLENYRKALTIFEEVGHDAGIADQCSNIGYVCSRHGESEDAVRYFGTARDLYLKIGESGKADLCDKNLQALEVLRKSQG